MKLFLSVLLLCANVAMASGTITVGSKNFTEQLILGELLAQTIEGRTQLSVERRFNLGGTQFVFEAVKKGEIDLYPEYTGTALLSILHGAPESKPAVVREKVSTAFLKNFNLRWMPPLGFSNTYALAVRAEDPRFEGVTRISQLQALAPSVAIGGTHEFMDRPDGFSRLSKHYSLSFRADSVRSLDPGILYTAIQRRQLDVIAAFSTDGRIQAFKLRILEDDRRFFPPYEAAAVVRADTLAEHPELEEALQSLRAQVSDEEMRSLNHQVDSLGKPVADVVREFLVKKGLIPANAASDQAVSAGEAFPRYFWANRAYVLRLVTQHLMLTLSALGLAMLFGIPLAIALTRMARLNTAVFSVINTIQTIPSLALLGFLIPLLGIGAKPAILALFLYALLPLVRNTYTGIREVDGELKEASRGIGLTDLQVLRMVEIPLAMPMIMAGVRNSAVILIGTATLAALIGAGGLGDPIFRGISSVRTNTILLGAVPAATLAVLMDQLFQQIERKLISKGLRINK